MEHSNHFDNYSYKDTWVLLAMMASMVVGHNPLEEEDPQFEQEISNLVDTLLDKHYKSRMEEEC